MSTSRLRDAHRAGLRSPTAHVLLLNTLLRVSGARDRSTAHQACCAEVQLRQIYRRHHGGHVNSSSRRETNRAFSATGMISQLYFFNVLRRSTSRSSPVPSVWSFTTVALRRNYRRGRVGQRQPQTRSRRSFSVRGARFLAWNDV